MAEHLVYFAHGKESGPWGTKIQVLADRARQKGFHVESPDYSAINDADARVDFLLALKPKAQGRLVLVGSSMGAYVSAAAAEKIKPDGLFLMAPAVLLEGFGCVDLNPVATVKTIVHGWHDDVIPVDHAYRFAQLHAFELHLLDSDHRLISKLDELVVLFDRFLETVLLG